MTITATEVQAPATPTAADGLEAVRLLGARYLSLTGRVVPYGQAADVGLFLETFARGAFTGSLTERPAVPLLLWHDNASFPIGIATGWDDRPDGLYGQFRLALTPIAQVAGQHAHDGFLSGMSVGFVAQRSSWRYAGREWNPDLGPDYMDHVTRHTARLVEVSLTPTPAYDDARIVDVQAAVMDDATLARMIRQLPAPDAAPDDMPPDDAAPDAVPDLAPTPSIDPVTQRLDTLEAGVASIAVRLEVLEGTIAGNATPYDPAQAAPLPAAP